MGKFKREFKILKPSECNFFFYAKSGSWGMYCRQDRNYFYCIPFLIGFRYSESWGG